MSQSVVVGELSPARDPTCCQGDRRRAESRRRSGRRLRTDPGASAVAARPDGRSDPDAVPAQPILHLEKVEADVVGVDRGHLDPPISQPSAEQPVSLASIFDTVLDGDHDCPAIGEGSGPSLGPGFTGPKCDSRPGGAES
jgi:hypothetical protein